MTSIIAQNPPFGTVVVLLLIEHAMVVCYLVILLKEGFMSISYYLRKNHLTEEPDDYRAYVSASNTVDLENLINWMLERGSTVTKADILSVFEDFGSALEFMLNEGYNVNTPFANFRSGIKGVFMGNTDVFDTSRHQVRPRISTGLRLRE